MNTQHTGISRPQPMRRRLIQAAALAALSPALCRAAPHLPGAAQATAPLSAAWTSLPAAGAVRLSGRLVDAMGAPLAGRRVELADALGHAVHDICDGDGRFLLGASGMNGELHLAVEGDATAFVSMLTQALPVQRDEAGAWRSCVAITLA